MATSVANKFGAADYAVFGVSLALSAAIGIYFGCTGKKQSTTREFLLADRSMSFVPVAMSLLASFISAITVLGMPAETYTYGHMYMWSIFGFLPAIFLSAHVYMPVFYRLELTSVYQYLEMRFNRTVRVISACCFILQTVIYLTIVMYAPSLAISAVTGINTWLSVLAIAIVCTFYTCMGGMKAVLWTDTLQVIIMFMGALAVLIKGFIICGWDQVWKDATDSGRLAISIDPNPQERSTVWSMMIGGSFFWLSIFGVTQTQVQRALTIPTLRKLKLAFYLDLPLLVTITSISCVVGIIIYSYFKACDPLLSGQITALDQLYPLFVMEALGHLPGLPGLIIAAVASSSLSTISSGLNSLAAVVLVDLVNLYRSNPLPDRHAAILSRVIAVGLGLVCIGLTVLVSKVKTILQAASSLHSVCGGPILGIFTLGLLFPCANGKGGVVGLLASIAVTGFIGFGAQFNPRYIYRYPTSIDGCSPNSSIPFANNYTVGMEYSFSTTLSPSTTKSVEHLLSESRSGVGGAYSISYMWLTAIATVVCVFVGLLVSGLTGKQDAADLDPRLISPVADIFCCCLPPKLRTYLYCGVNHEDIIDSNSNQEETGKGVYSSVQGEDKV